MIQIQKTSDTLTKKNIVNRVSYIPGGVSLALTNLVAGNVVPEGTPLTAPSSGLRTICKQAVVLTGSTTTAIQIEEGTHQFKVGDFIGVKTGGKAYAITDISNASGIDTLTVGTAIGTPVVGGFIYEMAAEAAATTSALKNTADVILETAFIAPSVTNIIFMNDALLRADVLQNVIGSEYLATLDVKEVKY